MRKWAVLILGTGGGLLLLFLFALGLWVAREYQRDPMPLLDQACAPLVIRSFQVSTLRTAAEEVRSFIELELDGAPEGPVRIAISLPVGTKKPLPVAIILGGLEAGRESLRYVDSHGPNALVALAYPRPTDDLYEGRPLLKLPGIRRAALAVPSQICALRAWIRGQTWADSQRVSLLGYSFGAMFVPACARVAQARGIPFRALVMAYGGADLPGLLAVNADLKPAWVRPLASRIVGSAIRPLEPALHLPHLNGNALFITGLKDELVPLSFARRMQALKPDPKTVLDLEEGHMGPARPELTRKVISASRAWLAEQGALDAF